MKKIISVIVLSLIIMLTTISCYGRGDFVLQMYQEDLPFIQTPNDFTYFVFRDMEWKLERWGEFTGKVMWSILLPTHIIHTESVENE